jgi:hypothetical protein
MSVQNDNQSQYKITQAYITSESLGGDVDPSARVNINSSIVELVFFESLEKAYISGQIAVSDDQGFVDAIGFSGTERLFIEMATEDPSLQPVMSRSFIMTSIDQSIKSNDAGQASIYVFTIIDEHAFLSKTKKVSRSLTDSLENEIMKLCIQDMKKKIDVSYLYPSIQNNVKVLIPYLHPLEACEWLRDRATTVNGCPLFLYASIHDTNLRLGSLDKMLEQKPWNEKLPYLYSPSNVRRTEDKSPLHRTMQVQTMRSSKMQNTMKQLMSGGIGAIYNNTNLGTGQVTSQRFDVTKVIKKLVNNEIIPNNKTQNVYPEEFKIDDKSLHNQEAKIFHQITSTGTYGTWKSYHDELKPGTFTVKVGNYAIRNMLYKNMFEVTVPGAGFIVSKASVGDIVTINTLSDDGDNTTRATFDQLRSGDFLIYNVRHTFKNTRHDVVMSVCKLVRG